MKLIATKELLQGNISSFEIKKKHKQKSDNKNKQDNVTELCLLGENKIRFNKSI